MDKARETLLKETVRVSEDMKAVGGMTLMCLALAITFMLGGNDITKDGGSAGTTCSTIAMILLIPFLALGIKFLSLANNNVGLFTFVKDGEKAQEELNLYYNEKANESQKNMLNQVTSRVQKLVDSGTLPNLKIAREELNSIGHDTFSIKEKIADKKEELLDYAGAIADFERLGLHQDAKRVRRKMLDEKKVDQTVVHGDYVDDRDTIVKDSVINRSNVGAGGDDKFARLEKLTEMKKEGLIDADDYEKMKREIIG